MSQITETPMGTPSTDNIQVLRYNIKDYMGCGYNPVTINHEVKYLELNSVVYYWYEMNGTIVLAVELVKESNALRINLTGKDPAYTNKAPFADDLYVAILKQSHKPITLRSDDKLSDAGYSIWKRLLRSGHTIKVYDNQKKSEIITLSNEDEMNMYFKHDDPKFKQYQYVLSESIKHKVGSANWFRQISEILVK